MQTKFIIAGRTSSGKDYLTNYLCATFGFKQLLSYTTRPKRFDTENTHIFITDEEEQNILNTQSIIAYTGIGQYKYFGTYQQFIESDIYIVDKQGIDYLKQNFTQQLMQEQIQIVVIYVYAEKQLRQERALKRHNNLNTYVKRDEVENAQFTALEHNVEFDWFVRNHNENRAKRVIKEIVNLYI
jgi:hypothetical protein